MQPIPTGSITKKYGKGGIGTLISVILVNNKFKDAYILTSVGIEIIGF